MTEQEKTAPEQQPDEQKQEKTEEVAQEEKAEQPTEEVTEQPKEEVRELPEVRAGYTVRLHLKISEGKKERIQYFEGMVLKVSGATPETRTITVRKESKGFGVEKIIPLAMPSLVNIEVLKKAKVRRANLSFLRKYKKRLKETMVK